MLVYLTMITLCLLTTRCAMLKYKQGTIVNLALLLISIILPTIIAGLRYYNGADYGLYLNIFETYANGNTFVSVKTLEPGFIFLVKLCQLFTKDYWLTFLVIAFVIDAMYFIGSWRMSKNILVSIFLFFATGTYFDSFNGLRQYLAAALTFFAFYYLINDKWKIFITLVLIASLFHVSALLVLPLYFLKYVKFDVEKSLIVIFTVLFGGSAIYRIITFVLQFTRYRYFLTSIEYEKAIASQSAILFSTVITIIFFSTLYFNKGKLTDSENIYLNLQTAITAMSLITTVIPLSYRVLYYLSPLEIIIIPNFLQRIKKRKLRKIVTYFILLFYAGITIYGMCQNGWYTAIPYQFYFRYMH